MKKFKSIIYLLGITFGLSGCAGCNCDGDRARFIGNWDFDTIVSSQSPQGELAEDYFISIYENDEDECIMYIQGFEGFGNGVTIEATRAGNDRFEIPNQSFSNVLNTQGRNGLTIEGEIVAILGPPVTTGGYGVQINAEIWEDGTFYDDVSIVFRDQ